MGAGRAAAPVATGERVALHEPMPEHAEEFCAAARRSVDLHRPWLEAPTDTPTYLRYLDRVRQPGTRGFLVRQVDDEGLVGFVNVNDIVGGAARSASVGYAAFVPHHGQGLLRDGLSLALDVAFGTLRLHRVEANIQPGNSRSAGLVRSLGFRLEGFSPRFLYISGDWRDHHRWAILAEEWLARSPAAGA